MKRDAASAWDQEYRRGRYRGESPVAFVDDILTAVHSLEPAPQSGLYIGCGNGRNYIPLVKGGLDLDGIDISAEAIDQLRERLPERRDRLIHGDLRAIPPDREFEVVIGIQVFQHGTRDEAHAILHEARRRVSVGGLFCLRVNAVGTDVRPAHDVIEELPDGGFTVRYLSGPKTGLAIHFFSREEIDGAFTGWKVWLPLRLSVTSRMPPEGGQWSQWEGVWQRVR